jgi:hypothetical protein
MPPAASRAAKSALSSTRSTVVAIAPRVLAVHEQPIDPRPEPPAPSRRRVRHHRPATGGSRGAALRRGSLPPSRAGPGWLPCRGAVRPPGAAAGGARRTLAGLALLNDAGAACICWRAAARIRPPLHRTQQPPGGGCGGSLSRVLSSPKLQARI